MPSAQSQSNGANTEYELCLHCSLKLISQSDRKDGFCCSGCRAAYTLINGLGLDYYYLLRERTDTSTGTPVALQTSSFSHFDDANFSKLFILDEGQGLKQIAFYLSGIHCTACVWLLEKLPQVVEGMLEVRVDLIRGRALVRYNENTIKASAIARAFSSLGYQPHPLALDGQNKQLSREDNIFLIQLGVAAFAAMNVMLLFFGRHQGYLTGMQQEFSNFFAWVSFLLSIPVVTFSALPFYKTSLSALRSAKLHIDLPISVAVVAGFAASAVNTLLGHAEIYFDTVTALVFLLLLGRLFQRRALKKVADTTDLMYSVTPLSAIRIDSNGEKSEIFIGSIQAGNTLLIEEGAKIPCDGKLLSNEALLDNSILSGESTPVKLLQGTSIYAGTINLGSQFIMQAESVGPASRIGKMMDQIRTAALRDTNTARFVDSISGYFVIAVLTLAIITFAIYIDNGFWVAWDRLISLLVVSCPCALGIATPVTLSLASARAAKRGILIKDGPALERLATITSVFFDKTGTLTEGRLILSDATVLDENTNIERVMQIAAKLEENIQHPLARAISQYYTPKESHFSYSERKQISGKGIEATSQTGINYKIGSLDWVCNSRNIAQLTAFINKHSSNGATIIALSANDNPIACFAFTDGIRAEAAETLRQLNVRGIKSAIVSGDSSATVRQVAMALNLESNTNRGSLLPEQKASLIEEYGEHVAFVGDGVNDGLALSRAAVGIGISGGAEAALAVSDIYLMKADLKLIVAAIDGAKATRRQIHRHLGISLFYNIAAASLAVAGLIGPLSAALVMPLSSLTVIVSSLWRPPFSEEII